MLYFSKHIFFGLIYIYIYFTGLCKILSTLHSELSEPGSWLAHRMRFCVQLHLLTFFSSILFFSLYWFLISTKNQCISIIQFHKLALRCPSPLLLFPSLFLKQLIIVYCCIILYLFELFSVQLRARREITCWTFLLISFSKLLHELNKW